MLFENAIDGISKAENGKSDHNNNQENTPKEYCLGMRHIHAEKRFRIVLFSLACIVWAGVNL